MGGGGGINHKTMWGIGALGGGGGWLREGKYSKIILSANGDSLLWTVT